MCFEKVIRMEVGWFDEPVNLSVAIRARLSADAARVCGLVGDALAQLVHNSSLVVVGVVITFAACWQLEIIVLLLLRLIGLNGYDQLPPEQKKEMKKKKMEGIGVCSHMIFTYILISYVLI